MNAEKLLLKTDAQGWITGLPQFEPNQEVELIVLFSKKKNLENKPVYRTPPATLAGKTKILGDLIEPCFETRENNEEQAIHLKAEDMAFFLQALENPPKANEALKDAAKWHKQLISHA